MTEVGPSLSVTTLNINSLNSPIKRRIDRMNFKNYDPTNKDSTTV